MKERTEIFWNKSNYSTNTEGYFCPEWAKGAKRIGMTDQQIDSIEVKHNITFMPEHRAFLRILHTVDRKEVIEYEEEGEIKTHQRSFFYNWMEDDDEIVSTLSWPGESVRSIMPTIVSEEQEAIQKTFRAFE